jgi:hypothetical protein
MYSLLLKKAIPFALTFVIGSFVGGLFKSFVPGAQRVERPRAYYYYGPGESRSGCKHSRGRYLVAESKPLTILFKPDARWPRGADVGKGLSTEWVRVTFGADGNVQQVEPSFNPWLSKEPTGAAYAAIWASVEHAAREIRFTPESVNGLPVTVTREVEIRFTDE